MSLFNLFKGDKSQEISELKVNLSIKVKELLEVRKENRGLIEQVDILSHEKHKLESENYGLKKHLEQMGNGTKESLADHEVNQYLDRYDVTTIKDFEKKAKSFMEMSDNKELSKIIEQFIVIAVPAIDISRYTYESYKREKNSTVGDYVVCFQMDGKLEWIKENEVGEGVFIIGRPMKRKEYYSAILALIGEHIK
jgi:hypothetical protein